MICLSTGSVRPAGRTGLLHWFTMIGVDWRDLLPVALFAGQKSFLPFHSAEDYDALQSSEE
jgi:hypothetical protein